MVQSVGKLGGKSLGIKPRLFPPNIHIHISHKQSKTVTSFSACKNHDEVKLSKRSCILKSFPFTVKSMIQIKTKLL